IGLPPITRAILSQSIQDLNRAIALDPESVNERVCGFTTLQLGVIWPEGLQRLLETNARDLIDVGNITERTEHHTSQHRTPFLRALSTKCAESVHVLMKAGCVLDFDPNLEFIMLHTSDECITVLASNLAKRRRDLLRLCQEELGIHLDWNLEHVPDEKASALCAALARTGIPVPRHLSVLPEYGTIFHFSGLLFEDFEKFGGNGFKDFRSYNPMGLTPVMTWRHSTFRNRYVDLETPEEEEMYRVWRWAQDQGLLDPTQGDPTSLGLNTSATGWHYLAATLGFTYINNFYVNDEPFHHIKDYITPFPYRMISDLSQSNIRDRCACPCSPHGQGCSALKSLWKAHADSREPYQHHRAQAQDDMFWRHCLFHHHHNAGHPSQNNRDSIGNMSLELVRLVTFEILDMTHTCCYLERGNWSRSHDPHVIAVCDAEVAEEIRSDNLEQQNGHQLDQLMHEFEPQILALDFSDPKALELFIWGPWRRRISNLFAVDGRLVAEMEQVVDKVTVECKFLSSRII
ncbi:hypothetical protein C8A00DRAFT_14994, partial [Chaetomidium leptoderma]